ncbi:MAG: sigma-70 family RNA polymerase sigma factor [Planctomycetes bacterium]|nr:sigma-70 family RNA polymerase sigma factor [Planctomycetota bacterium]
MSSETTPGNSSAAFPTTAWSLIQAAGHRTHEAYLAAANLFIAGYWKPVFYFLRARGYPLHQAEDLTQDFFTRFLEGNWIGKADQNRGRFRSFLLRILIHFLSDQGPRRAPRQQRFEQQLLSINSLVGGDDRTYEPPVHETPETIFMKQWAAALVANVLERLRAFYREEDRAAWYDVFAASYQPSPPEEPPTQQALAERFGMSRDQVRYALEIVQKRFAHFLREEVRDQVHSEAEVADEIRDLLALLGK